MPEFFKSALAALPSAAQNPLAFMAYVMVIVSATIIALKAKRNQQLLANLEKLPAEDRLKALELEMESVRVPPNLTPEQWLQSRIQRYYFIGFAIVCLTVLLIVTLAVATREKKNPGSVDVSITPYVAPHEEGPAAPSPAPARPAAAPAAENDDEPAAPSKTRKNKNKKKGKRVHGRSAARHSRNPAPGAAPAPAAGSTAGSAAGSTASPAAASAPSPAANTPAPARPAADAADLRLSYSASRSGAKLVWEPRMPYLDKVKRGGPVAGVSYEWSPFQWEFPQISIKIANSTEQLVVPTEAVVQVRKSTPIKEPVIIFKDFSTEAVMIRNEGWGDVIDARLNLALDREDSCLSPSGELPPLEDAAEVSLGTFSDYKRVPILQYLASGLRVAERVCAFGELTYGDPAHRKTLKFKTRVALDRRVSQSLPPTNFYDICLEAGKQGYEKSIGLEQQVAGNAADHFVFTFASDQSARYELLLTLRAGGGKTLISQELDIEVFVPRSVAKSCQEGVRRTR